MAGLAVGLSRRPYRGRHPYRVLPSCRSRRFLRSPFGRIKPRRTLSTDRFRASPSISTSISSKPSRVRSPRPISTEFPSWSVPDRANTGLPAAKTAIKTEETVSDSFSALGLALAERRPTTVANFREVRPYCCRHPERASPNSSNARAAPSAISANKSTTNAGKRAIKMSMPRLGRDVEDRSECCPASTPPSAQRRNHNGIKKFTYETSPF